MDAYKRGHTTLKTQSGGVSLDFSRYLYQSVELDDMCIIFLLFIYIHFKVVNLIFRDVYKN